MVVLRKALACLFEKQCHPYLLLEPVSIVRCNLVIEVRHANFLDELGHTLCETVHVCIDNPTAVSESLQVGHHVPSLEAGCLHGRHVLRAFFERIALEDVLEEVDAPALQDGHLAPGYDI